MDNNWYLNCTIILCVNLLTTTKIWDENRKCKLLAQVQKFNNTWYLNITAEQKYPQYLRFWNHELPSYIMNVPWKWSIATTTRTYSIDYYIRSSNIKTSMRLSGMCKIKWYIPIYIPVHMKYICRWYYLRIYCYTYTMVMENWYTYNMRHTLYSTHVI